MSARRIAAWICAVAAWLVAPGAARAQVLSPGALSKAHASLDTDDDCAKCHESGRRVAARACLACHQDLASELAANRGLHGKQYQGKPCEDCHVEHLGRNSKLVRWPGGAMDKLDHALTGYRLDGGHAGRRCLDCHKKTSPLGKPQFLQTSTACASCHRDPHQRRFGNDCQRCHSITKWDAFDRKAFDHALATFPLTGKHTAVGCEKCHGAPPKWKPLAAQGCDNCHADPHAGRFAPKPCASCHETTGWAGAAERMRGSHPKLSLAGGHAKVACKTCHDRGTARAPSKGGACASCHAPVHIAPFGDRCQTCHGGIRWLGLPEAVGREAHARTRYPLEGAHANGRCAGCHPTTTPVAKRYRGLAFDRCASCHADVHRGAFRARDNGECAQCHRIGGFAPTTFGLDLHATTRFPLAGKHAATPCLGCHPKSGAGPRSFAVAATACADCHQNPHGAQFAEEMARGGCATCHDPADWRRPRIDHTTWPLTGAHARAACAGCHGDRAQGAEPAAYRGIPRSCEGCHDDVHAGQFRQSAPVRACEDCHRTESFAIARTFDHAATKFPLAGKHAQTACAACHPKAQLRDGSTAVRWRLGYTQCKDCHASPHREVP